MKNPAKTRILESAVCTAVALTILSVAAACGGASSPITGIIGGAGAAVARLSSHPKSHSSIYAGSGSGGFISAMFATLPVASLLPESYEGQCDVTSVSLTILTSGFVELNVPNGPLCTNGAVSFTNTIGFDNTGIPVALSGTVTTLKVSVITVANQRLRCIAQNGNAPVNDNDLIEPYYDFRTNTAFLGDGKVQLPISCVVPVAAGDQAEKITMEWSKI